jgi:high-affinity iron transporter
MVGSIFRRRALVVAALLTAVGVFVLFTVLGVGADKHSHTSATRLQTPLGIYHARAPHVLSEVVINSAQGAVSGAAGTPPTELRPVSASGFDAPIAAYRAYAADRLGLMQTQIARLEDALRANDRASAQAAWREAYVSYLGLGTVYTTGTVADLNQQIDGVPGGLDGGVRSPEFTGLHRLEYGLWGTARPSSLLLWAHALATDVGKLRVVLPHASVGPLEYATRAHEILEDAARDLLSGTDVPWSGEGVLGTRAGLEATREIVGTLRGLLGVREGVIGIVDAELSALGSTFLALSSAYGGRLPTNSQLTHNQAERLDSALGGALEALSQIPGTLETEPAPQIPQIPRSQDRIDP